MNPATVLTAEDNKFIRNALADAVRSKGWIVAPHEFRQAEAPEQSGRQCPGPFEPDGVATE